MASKVNISCIICIFAMLLAAPRQTAANAVDDQQFNKGLESFGTRLFAQLAEEYPQRNIVISPFSIQTCITMARMGAEGQTADEIDEVLALSAQNPEDLANNYHGILEKYENNSILQIANKIYAMTGYTVQDKFNELLTKKFYSAVDSLDFANNVPAANAINSWVEQKTNHKITNLIDPSTLNADTRLVLVNAIHFKGNWVKPFSAESTREMDFYLDKKNTTKVQMMHVKDTFKYAELNDLDAKVLEMPYKNSDLSMLIILPNKRTGLVELENKLKHVSLENITNQMRSTKVIVDMPKFKAEFQSELTSALSKMQLKRMFAKNAEFGKMLKTDESLYVSAVVHKAFIEVNESGTEAAAATAMGIALSSMPLFEELPQHFNANKPFYYVLINRQQLAIFQGTIQHF